MPKLSPKAPRRPPPREFNITGSIIPEEHYYVDLAPALKKLMELVEKKKYFVINRPRQFGKTTTLNFLAQYLLATKQYAPALISFEDFTQRPDITEADFYSEIILSISEELNLTHDEATETVGSASPFNIAIDYELSVFSRENVSQYYLQHTAATGQSSEEAVISRVHETTNGHPWLVSMLAKLLVENIVPNRKQRIRLDHAERAIQELLDLPNPNFDSVFKSARHPKVLPIVLDLLEGKQRVYKIQSNAIRLGVKYGLFAARDRQLILGNPIYAQALYQHFGDELEEFDVSGLAVDNQVQAANGWLDFRRLLDKFQAFMKAKGATVSKHRDFREATGQLLLLSYLDLLVNGKGWTFKEPQSGDGRIDVVCCYGRQKEIVELKLWYGGRRYQAGLAQLARYLDREGLDHGYLFVFDRRENVKREYSFSEHTVAGKKILAWVA